MSENMKGLYSIGDIAKISDISIKALRYYDKIGLLKPSYTDERSRRYYTQNQFWYIDKIKRFKYIGMPLIDLKKAFDDQSTEELKKFLQENINFLNSEEKRLEDIRKDVNWLIEFYEYAKKLNSKTGLYFREIEERSAAFVPCQGFEDVYYTDMQLRRILSKEELKDCKVTTPYGYILNCEKFMNNEFYPEKSTVFFTSSSEKKAENLIKIPRGNFLCYQLKLLNESPNFTDVIKYFKSSDLKPILILVNEYQVRLHDLRSSPYEIQILF